MGDEYNKVKINQVLIVTVLLNLILVGIKLGIGYIANSKALLADGLHSVSDVITTIGVIVGLVLARKPRDEEHQYGHEKIETITTFLLSIILLYTGIKIGINALGSIIDRQSVVPGSLAIYGAFLSIIIKEAQYQYVVRLGRKINSSALVADAWHHRSDAFSSIAALIGIIGSRLGFIILDSIAAGVVSVIVIKIGVSIFIDCFNQLIDTSISLVELDEIKKSVIKHKEIININDIRTRNHGSKVFIDIRLCVDSNITLRKGHDITEDIEKIIKSKIGNVKDIVIHLDPCNFDVEVDNECNRLQCKNV